MSDFELKVIGAGWGRTGTKSLKEALEILGFHCYHMLDNIKLNNDEFWIRVADGQVFDFDEVFNVKPEPFDATVDYPAAVYWRELVAKYPNAKVILTARDPEKWYASCTETIFCAVGGSPHKLWGLKICSWLGMAPGEEMGKKVVGRDAFGDDWSKENVIKQYVAHNEEVKRECPAEKLLVFEVSEGWEPLCAYLNKPVPSQPFPHVNDRAYLRTIMHRFNLIGWLLFLSACVGGMVMVYVLFFNAIPAWCPYLIYTITLLLPTLLYASKMYVKSL